MSYLRRSRDAVRCHSWRDSWLRHSSDSVTVVERDATQLAAHEYSPSIQLLRPTPPKDAYNMGISSERVFIAVCLVGEFVLFGRGLRQAAPRGTFNNPQFSRIQG